ncbi:MAG: MBL fold metallo-hydrolase, partial [bacterium]|nr:MBL fold metallo-hydrolase [bacterium]
MININTIDTDIIQFIVARKIMGMSLYRSSCYYIEGLLIDSGSHHKSMDLLQNMSGKIDVLHTIVNTHEHEDHIGSNALLREKYPDVKFYAHKESIPIIAQPRKLELRRYQRFLFGWPLPSQAEPAGETISTPSFTFKIVHTPGHCPGHICLFEEERGWLFCGDAYIGTEDHILRIDNDVWPMIDSLKKLRELPVKLMLTGSGGIAHNPIEKLNKKIDYLEEKAEQVWHLHKKGMDNLSIAGTLFNND